MKAKVIRAFWDMQDEAHKTYHEGDEFEGTADRVKGLEEKGFVEAIPEKKAAPRKRAAKPKQE